MDKFENYFQVTEELYCEALHKMMPASRYVIYAIATIILLVSSVVLLIAKNYQLGILWLILAVVIGFRGFFGIKFKAKSFYRKSISTLVDKDGIFWKHTVFYEKEFKVNEPRHKATFKYSSIRAVNESKNLYVLVMEEKQILFLKKGEFKGGTDSEFIEFLKIKCNAAGTAD